MVQETRQKKMYVHLDVCCSVVSHAQLFATPWTVAHQAPLSMGFSRQECWSGLPFPPPGDLPNAGIELAFPASLALQTDSLLLNHQRSSTFGLFISKASCGSYQGFLCSASPDVYLASWRRFLMHTVEVLHLNFLPAANCSQTSQWNALSLPQ